MIENDETTIDYYEDDVIGTELQSNMSVDFDADFSIEANSSALDLFDANFEKELGFSKHIFTSQDMIDNEFSEIAKLNIVQVGGDDKFGKKVIIIYGCRLPPHNQINLDRFWAYTVKTLRQFVSNDYSLIYFHYGLTEKNNPGIKFMLNAYKQIDRDFKKNLKNLYIVHPTGLLKFIINALLPFFSAKVKNKIIKVRKLKDLESQFYLDQMVIPELIKTHDRYIHSLINSQRPHVWRFEEKINYLCHDAKLDSPNSLDYQSVSVSFPGGRSPLYEIRPESQFGVSLQHIKQYYTKYSVPPVMEQCISYLRSECLDCEGIFRRSPSKIRLLETQRKYDMNEFVDLSEMDDPHLAASLLKTFLRSLKEPLMTFELHDEIIKIHNCKTDVAVEHVRQIVSEMLPHYNYQVLKFLIGFLIEVANHSDNNKMTFQNLANVFAPSLIWSRHETSFSLIHLFINFTHLLLTHYSEIFVKDDLLD